MTMFIKKHPSIVFARQPVIESEKGTTAAKNVAALRLIEIAAECGSEDMCVAILDGMGSGCSVLKMLGEVYDEGKTCLHGK